MNQSPYRRRHVWRSEACRPSYRRSPSKSAPRSLKRTAIFVVSQLRSPRCKGQASTRPADPPCGPPPSVGAAENPVTVQGHSDVPLDNGSCGEAASSPHFGRRSKEVSAPGHDLLGMIWYVGSVYTSGIAPAGLASPTDPKKVYAYEERNCLTSRFPGDGHCDPAWRFCSPAACFPGRRIFGRCGSREH
jgi:hypothetical protein